MQKRKTPALRLSLLSCAIAMAAVGAAQSAYAVDICTGDSSVSVGSAVAGTNCTLDTVDATLNVTGKIDQGVLVTATGVKVTNSGTISDDTTALYFQGVGMDHPLANSGKIEADGADGYAVYIDGSVNGNITNSGSLKASAENSYSANAYALYVGGLTTGNVSNTGTISADSRTTTNGATVWNYAAAVYLSNGLDGNLNNSGSISTTVDSGEGDYNFATTLYIGSTVNGDITNSGKIISQIDGDYYAYGYAIDVSGDLNGTLRNSGTIASVVNARYGGAYGAYLNGDVEGVVNSGSISATAYANDTNNAYATALYIGGDVSAAFLNSGSIKGYAESFSDYATAYAAYISGDIEGTAKLGNSGQITAAALAYESGAEAYAWYQDGNIQATFNNTGTISATATSYGSTATASAMYVGGGLKGGSIINSGTISAVATGQDYGYAYGIVMGQHTFTTASAGTAWAAMSGDAKIINNGTILADATGGTGDGEAYVIDLDGDMRENALIRNFGTLKGVGYSRETSVTITGISAYNMYENAAIVNNGNIVLTATSPSDYAEVMGIDVDDMHNDAAIVNTSRIDLLADAYWQATATGIEAGYLYDNASIRNSGTIAAIAKSVTSSASAYGIYTSDMYDMASILNTGTITASADASDQATAYGIEVGSMYDTSLVKNSGVITASAVSLDSSASAYGIYAGGVYDDAAIVNTGRISVKAVAYSQASAYGIESSGQVDGSISNSGLIDVSALSTRSEASAYGIYGYGMTDGSITNTGTIRVVADGTSSATAYGIVMYGDLYGTSKITNNGLISAHASDLQSSGEAYGIYTYSLHGDAAIVNNGRIDVVGEGRNDAYGYAYGIETGTLYDNAAVTNAGLITAKASSGGTSYAYAYGIYTGELYGASTLTNSGAIVASATADVYSATAYGLYGSWLHDTAAVTNSGAIRVYAEGQTSAEAYGMYFGELQNSASITNSGSIGVVALNHQTDSATAYGIRAGSLNDTTAITNDGVIRVAAVNDGLTPGASAYAYGIYSGYVSGTSAIANTGNIVVSADAGMNASAYAYGVYQYSSLDGSLTNDGNILASAAAGEQGEAYAYGVYVDGALNGTLTNNRVIGGMAGAGRSQSAYAIYATGGGSGSVVNNGALIGSLYLPGSVSVSNDGLILTDAKSSTIGGDFTQGGGAALALTLRDTSDYGAFSVGGTADFSANGKVFLVMDPKAVFHEGDVLTDVVYANTLTANAGGFTVVENSLFYNFEKTEDANGFDLTVHTVAPSSVFASAGMTLTASQADLVEDLLGGNASSDYAGLQGALNSAGSAADAARVLESVGPAWSGAGALATRVASTAASNALSARQGETRGAASGDAFTRNSVWIKPFLGMASQDAGNGVSGFDVDTTGFIIGIDGNVTDDARLGIAVASSQSNGDGGSADLDIDTTQFSVYGSYALGSETALDADLSYGANGYDSTRRVAFAPGNAVADYDGTQLALGATLSHRMTLSDKAALVPAVSLRYSKVDIDGYSESGAGAYSLTVEDSSEDSFLLAAKAGYELTLANKGVFLANLGLGYDTADQASATATLSGNGPTFVSNGVEPESMLVTGGIGYRHVTAKNLAITAAYDVESRSDFLGQTVSLKFKLPF